MKKTTSGSNQGNLPRRTMRLHHTLIHSMRRMTDGSGAVGKPWRELRVFDWHPGRKQVCLLGLSPFARGVSEGTIRFEGETADAVFDRYQSGGRRKMGLRWAFDGSDKYHEILLEATGPDGLKPMNEWDHVRSKTLTATRPRAAKGAPKPSERLKVLEPFLGHTWEAKGGWELDLKGYEGDRVVRQVVRFDFERDGTLRHRVWSLEGADRKFMLDVHHKKLEPKKD
jgi:hypothetical protein